MAIVAIVDGRIRSDELAGACLLRGTSGGSFAIYINVWCLFWGAHYMPEVSPYMRVEFGSGFGMIGTLETPFLFRFGPKTGDILVQKRT